jgi:hypothetical protein
MGGFAAVDGFDDRVGALLWELLCRLAGLLGLLELEKGNKGAIVAVVLCVLYELVLDEVAVNLWLVRVISSKMTTGIQLSTQ